MHIAVVSLFPEMFAAVADYGVTGRAVDRGQLRLFCVNPRDFTHDKHQTVDDRPYGGGPGMVMMVEPLEKAVTAAQRWMLDQTAERARVIYLSPQGRTMNQGAVKELAESSSNLILIAGRYEGIDQRFIDRIVDDEWSIGDYVVSGGELPAMVMVDAITRLLPGVLGDEQSAEQDSFVAGLLDCPHYTRPCDYHGERVPEVLLSGDHKQIDLWRSKQALGRTWERRPDLLDALQLSDEQIQLLERYKAERSAGK